MEMIKDYQTNINYETQFAQFYEDVQQAGALQTEEEGDTQNLYRELTSVIQEIITDPGRAGPDGYLPGERPAALGRLCRGLTISAVFPSGVDWRAAVQTVALFRSSL